MHYSSQPSRSIPINFPQNGPYGNEALARTVSQPVELCISFVAKTPSFASLQQSIPVGKMHCPDNDDLCDPRLSSNFSLLRLRDRVLQLLDLLDFDLFDDQYLRREISYASPLDVWSLRDLANILTFPLHQMTFYMGIVVRLFHPPSTFFPKASSSIIF